MTIEEAIKTRKSVRQFQDTEIEEKDLEKILEAFRLAPSGNNAQPWRILTVKDKKEKEILNQKKAFVQDFVVKAPVIIVCTADPSAYQKKVSGVDDDNKARALRDLSIASAFSVLQATELGIGSCYVGWRNEKIIKEIYGIPENFVLPYVIALGYPEKSQQAITKERKKIEEIIIKNNVE